MNCYLIIYLYRKIPYLLSNIQKNIFLNIMIMFIHFAITNCFEYIWYIYCTNIEIIQAHIKLFLVF